MVVATKEKTQVIATLRCESRSESHSGDSESNNADGVQWTQWTQWTGEVGDTGSGRTTDDEFGPERCCRPKKGTTAGGKLSEANLGGSC